MLLIIIIILIEEQKKREREKKVEKSEKKRMLKSWNMFALLKFLLAHKISSSNKCVLILLDINLFASSVKAAALFLKPILLCVCFHFTCISIKRQKKIFSFSSHFLLKDKKVEKKEKKQVKWVKCCCCCCCWSGLFFSFSFTRVSFCFFFAQSKNKRVCTILHEKKRKKKRKKTSDCV